MMNAMQETNYSTEENKKKFISESFKIDEIKITFSTNLEEDQQK